MEIFFFVSEGGLTRWIFAAALASVSNVSSSSLLHQQTYDRPALLHIYTPSHSAQSVPLLVAVLFGWISWSI